MVQHLVQSRHPHVILRGKTYYFRYAYPKHLRSLCPWLPVEVKRSLRTSSFSEAVSLVEAKKSLLNVLSRCSDSSLVEELCARLLDFSDGIKQWVKAQYQALTGGYTRPQVVSVVKPKKTPRGPKLSRVWSEFVAWKNWSDRRARNNQVLFDNLKHFLGDIAVTRITKSDIRSALESISKLPVRNKRPYSRMTIREMLKRNIPESDLISDKLVKEHLKLAQGLFNSFMVRERDILQVSPTEGVRWEVQDRRFGCLNDAQVRGVIQRVKTKPEWFEWFLKLALYSGARRSEIAALRPTDVRFCHDTQRHYFVIHKGKTKAAKRVVPLHNRLVEEGFLDWIGEGSELIFPIAANTPNRVTDNFASLLDVHKTDMGERLVFHSTRHTVITKIRSSGVNTPLLQQVIGHEKTGAGVTDRYTHSFQMKDVLSVIDCITYEA